MIESPNQPVSFVIYKTSERAESNMLDRRLLYVQNRNHLPFGVWCKWIVEGKSLFLQSYSAFILVCLIA